MTPDQTVEAMEKFESNEEPNETVIAYLSL